MEAPDRREAEAGIAEAVVEERRRGISLVWLIPLVALLSGAFVAYRVISERGESITISFASAEGLEAGKTKIRFKEVEVGLVETIELAPDLGAVTVSARMVPGIERYLTDATRFWVVKARVAAGQVQGLGTLFSGAYIGMDPSPEGARTRAFRALDAPPVVTADEPGRHFVLRSYQAGAVEVGSPVYYRKIRVGEVVSSDLAPSGEYVDVRVFVHAPHDTRVRSGTRFWKATGIDVSMGPSGVQVDTESVVSLLVGGVAFDTPVDGSNEVATEDAVFPLYPNHAATEKEIYTEKVAYLLHFDQSVRGLAPGSPVEFRGIPVGQVRDVRLEFDREASRFRIPVVIEMEPQRFGNPNATPDERRAAADAVVAAGLRAQLKMGNLLTGQLVVALDMHPEAPPARIRWDGPVPEFPTVPAPLDEITASATKLAQRLGEVPIDEIAADLQRTIRALDALTQRLDREVAPALTATLEETKRTVAGASGLVAPGSALTQELQRTLVELGEAARSLQLAADQIEREPSSILFGKDSSR